MKEEEQANEQMFDCKKKPREEKKKRARVYIPGTITNCCTQSLRRPHQSLNRLAEKAGKEKKRIREKF